MHCIAEACILRAHPTQRYYLSRQAHPTCISYCRQITYEAHPACGYGPYVPCGQLIQDCVSLSWVSPSNGNVDTRTGRTAGIPPRGDTVRDQPGHLPCTCMLGERICARSRVWLQSFGSRRAFAHVRPTIIKPLLILARVHPPLIVLGYITLCCHRFCDTIALCRGNPKRNDTGACMANTVSCAQSIKPPPRRWSSATHSSSLSPL